MEAEWWSIEVFDAAVSARSWRVATGDALTVAALSGRAVDWNWHVYSWGLVFEVSFRDEADWQAWCLLPAVRAAFDAVPDPLTGLYIHRGRGGASGEYVPRRPRPAPSAAAVELPEAEDEVGPIRLDSTVPGTAYPQPTTRPDPLLDPA